MYKKFYEDVIAVQQKNYNDPSDFANDVLALLSKLEGEKAVEQKFAPDTPSADPFQCPYCLQLVYPPHRHS